jgi:DNA-binding NarL/FixJ family response regulator
VAAVSRAADEAREPARRAKVLPAFVAIVLTAGDISAARQAADDLTEIAAMYGTTALLAEASAARGAVLVASGHCREALLALREAVKLWRELNAPYDEARARMAVALACRGTGDEDSATLELEAARGVFRRLGAGPALAEVDSLMTPAGGGQAGLSPRELEVLCLLATGKTNRMIADELMLAVRTVDRHVSNILTKLGVASRSAATAYAYEHHLV